MVFVACGLSHKTAPLPLREQIAAHAGNYKSLLLNCVSQHAHEAMLLYTCHRTELYCYTPDPKQLPAWLAKQHALDLKQLQPHIYSHCEKTAIRHLNRVASGLDSMLLGEPQILGQVKQAYHQACQVGTIGKQLHHILQHVFATSKQVRSDTVIGSKAISIAYAAAEFAQQLLTDLASHQILLIGSGDTIRLAADYLQQRGARQFLLVNRPSASSKTLAMRLNARYVDIHDLNSHLSQADLIISATACPLPFINQAMMRQALQQRRQRPMVLLDLAVPRDIEANVDQLDGVKLYNIDDLQDVVNTGMDERRRAIPAAEQIIDAALARFQEYKQTAKINEVIQQYRSQMSSFTADETQRALKQIQQGKDNETVIRELSHRLFNKLAHQPTVRLQQAARDGNEQVLAWMQAMLKES